MARLYGIHAVNHALKRPGAVKQLWVQESKSGERIQALLQTANEAAIPIENTDKYRLTQLAGTDKHQGVVAEFDGAPLQTLAELETVLVAKDDALLLALDGVQDPHNLGACIRSANAFCVDALITPKKNTAPMSAVTHKVAAGGASFTPVIQVGQLTKTLTHFKHYGLQCVGLAGEASKPLHTINWHLPTFIIMGAEGEGLTPAVRDLCDELVHIPMQGQVSSLNVSVATGIVLYEVQRARLNSNQ